MSCLKITRIASNSSRIRVAVKPYLYADYFHAICHVLSGFVSPSGPFLGVQIVNNEVYAVDVRIARTFFHFGSLQAKLKPLEILLYISNNSITNIFHIFCGTGKKS